jgi:hypothetical protein
VQIPQGAIINSATLELYVYSLDEDSPNFTVYANGDDDTGATGAAADFVTNANVIQRARTNMYASVPYTADVGTIGWYTVPQGQRPVMQKV